jgi:hypothetical protein
MGKGELGLSVDPSKVCLFIPPGLKKFKLNLFERIGRHVVTLGGSVIRHDFEAMDKLPDHTIPIVGCNPEFRHIIAGWRARKREWIYWDRGYARRVFATWLPRGENGGYYRWHRNCFQLQELRDVPADRWNKLDIGKSVREWNRNGKHIVIADTGPEYWDLHDSRDWADRTIDELRKYTSRSILIRGKKESEDTKRDLIEDIKEAHALIAHGTIAAVESVILGCPVFVNKDSAASLVGETDLSKIETPVYPDRNRWMHNLAYNQFNEQELVDGTLWKLIS